MRWHAAQIDAVEQHPALLGRLEAREQPQQRALATAGRPEQSKELALIDIERQLIDRGHAAKTFADGLEPQQWLCGGIRPGRKIPARARADDGWAAGIGVDARHAGTLTVQGLPLNRSRAHYPPLVRVRRTASCQPAHLRARVGASMRGVKRRSHCQRAAKPARSGQTPALRPAR